MQSQMSDRLDAIREELDQAAEALEYAKAQYERSRVQYETSREKFRTLKQLATPMMTMLDWFNWQREHPAVQYAAMDMTEAVLAVLQSHAYQAANNTVYGGADPYNPWLVLEEIATTLESGGFDFRSTAPLREVNAALLNMEGRVKDETTNRYAIADHARILDLIRRLSERTVTQE